jgi:hypothetical protein
MKIRNLLMIVALIMSALLTTGFRLAWPDQPPDRATISGPGIAGVVEITDRNMLAALMLGTFEDFNSGSIKAPSISGEGYHITRYFYGGSFNFGGLIYYPPTATTPRGLLQFSDGPQLEGNHTPYNGQWLHATAQGDAAMQKLLVELNVRSAAVQAAPNVAPASNVGWLIVLLAAGVVVLGGSLVLVRKRARIQNLGS